MKKLLLLVGLLSVIILSAETEHITRFISNIHIEPEGSMIVTEEISVFAGGSQIQRGIYRDFPLYYKDKTGNNINVDFEILMITRDGKKEPYHTENLRNGIRIYIGDKDYFLPRGYYNYEITYRTDRQLGFFKDHDELYWNVTGNGWSFIIDYVRCSVFLPEGIDSSDIKFTAYTGQMGAAGKNYRVTEIDQSFAGCESKEVLYPYEGITIAVAWPKGFVDEPTQTEKMKYLIKDNIHTFIAVLGLILLFSYYIWAWVKVGKDPSRGTIIPLYEVPENLSPAAVRFIMKMGYDNKIFSAILMNLGVRGYIKIREEKKKFTLEKLKPADSDLSNEETAVMDELFEQADTLKLDRKNRIQILSAVSYLKKELNKKYKNSMFFLNSTYMTPAVLISIISVVAAFLLSPRIGGESMFLYIWLSLWTIGLMVMASAGFRNLTAGIRNNDKTKLFSSIIMLLIAIPFILIELFVIFKFSSNIPIVFNVVLLIMIGLHILFYDLLKAPSETGRDLMDKIEGFRMYLSAAEKDNINMHDGPPDDIDTYEKFLPFAFALDVENKWTGRFQSVIDKISQDTQTTYHPSWYIGTGSFSSGNFSSSFGSSLNSAVASSSSSSSSSSGFSGGSSGGGGGGGGGGGW